MIGLLFAPLSQNLQKDFEYHYNIISDFFEENNCIKPKELASFWLLIRAIDRFGINNFIGIIDTKKPWLFSYAPSKRTLVFYDKRKPLIQEANNNSTSVNGTPIIKVYWRSNKCFFMRCNCYDYSKLRYIARYCHDIKNVKFFHKRYCTGKLYVWGT